MRLLVSFVAFGLVSNQLRADLAPPPPPKGMKYVSIENWVALENEITGYVFYVIVNGPEFGVPPTKYSTTYSRLTLSEKPQKLPTRYRRTWVSLIAVPEDAAKQYANEKDLLEAIEKEKIKGVHYLNFDANDLTSETDKRESIAWTHTITAVDGKNGFLTKTERDGKPIGNPQLSRLLVDSPRFICSASFATLSLITLGLWLARRSRSVY